MLSKQDVYSAVIKLLVSITILLLASTQIRKLIPIDVNVLFKYTQLEISLC